MIVKIINAGSTNVIRAKLKCVLFGACAVCLVNFVSAKSTYAQITFTPPETERQQELFKIIDTKYQIADFKSPDEYRKRQEALVAVINKELQGVDRNDELYCTVKRVIQMTNFTREIATLQRMQGILRTDFGINDDALMTEQIVEYLSRCNATGLDAAWPGLVAIVREAAEQEHYYIVKEVLARTITLANQHRAGAVKIKADLFKKRLEQRKSTHDLYGAAIARLNKEPENRKANFAVGFWLAVFAKRWQEALPYLANCERLSWQTAASLELVPGTNAEAYLKTADAWWQLYETYVSAAVDIDAVVAIGAHLQDIYATIDQETIAGEAKAIIADRQKKITATLAKEAELYHSISSSAIDSPGMPPLPVVTAPTPAPPLAPQLQPTYPISSKGEWVDLVNMVKVPDDVVLGSWSLSNHVLSCQASPDATCRFPVVVRGSYELEYTFVRKVGSEALFIYIPVERSGCTLVLSGWNGDVHALNRVDGKDGRDLDVATGAVFRPGVLPNSFIHNLRVLVTQGNGLAEVIAVLDGIQIVNWRGNSTSLMPFGPSNLNCPEALGVGAHQSIVDFGMLRFRSRPESTRRGVMPYSCAYKLGDDWRTSVNSIGNGPPAEIRTLCRVWNNRTYFVSPTPMAANAAQCLAKQLGGRLLTISTEAENEFILKEGKGLWLWMAAHRRTQTDDWRDERNRPLRYTGKFGPWQPNNRESETQMVIMTGDGAERGWHDCDSPWAGAYACIEWGEEY